MSYIHRLLGVAAVVLLSLAACSGDKSNGGEKQSKATAFPNSVVDEEVLVRVNSQPIWGKDLRVFTLIYGSGTQDSLRSRNFNERALDGLIDRQLLLQEAEATGVSVDDSTQQWFIRQFTQAVGGEAALNRLISSVGCSSHELEQIIRKDLIIRSFLESSVMATVEVPDSIALSYFQQNPDQFWVPDSVRARHIILRVSPDDTEADREAKKQTLRDLARRVKEGEDFAEMAKQYSEGPSAPRGGDLGYFTSRDMVPAFSNVAFGLEKGGVSGVVETPFGYHLIQVVDKKPGRKLEFDEISQGLKEQLRQYYYAQSIQNHLQRSRSVAIIERNYQP